jgi:putative methyltransferase (TIGR04325 family)
MTKPTLIASTFHSVKQLLKKTPIGRLRRTRFRGKFRSHAAAMRAVRHGVLDGYDHHEVVGIAYHDMCEITHWDYPVMFWLERLLSSNARVVDAGGHMGTKYRAFRKHLRLDERAEWVVYDLPAMVHAGRLLAHEERLHSLHFVDKLSDLPVSDILLASGLLQYLDVPLTELLQALPELPRHLLLNKVATRAGESLFTLENLGAAEVPYQVRDQHEVPTTLESLGYVIVDQWTIPSLSDAISSEANCGPVTSRGYYACRR